MIEIIVYKGKQITADVYEGPGGVSYAFSKTYGLLVWDIARKEWVKR